MYRGRLETPGGRARAWIDCLFIDHGILRLFWTNFATVAPGRLYRSNHPLPRTLRAAVRRRGIRTLINLRGRCENGSDALSREAAAQLGLAFHDMA
ncbi:MAG: protein tyrosine phosphatase, partial [Acetobacteraceae bacterium]